MNAELKVLQHSSDIRGIAISSHPDEKVVLNDEIIKKLTISFIQWLAEKKSKQPDKLKVSVGIDSRLSGPELKKAVIEILQSFGIHIFDCQMVITPALYLTVLSSKYKCDGAIMITASHLPFNWNGVKFLTSEGVLNKKDIQKIIENKSDISPGNKHGKIEEIDVNSKYANFMLKHIIEKANDERVKNQPLKGLKIIIDAANGAGGFIAEKILEPLGANTKGSIFLNPDGNFPNHMPNTEDDLAIKPLQKAVIDNDADLGIIFDSDCDKAAFVDNRGNSILRDRLVALIAAIIIEEFPKSTIVTDSITSDSLTDFIQNRMGGIHHRFKRGYKSVINEAIRLNRENLNCPVAIETSGHSAFRENKYIDDGMFMAAKVLIRLAKFKQVGKHDICELIKDYSTTGENLQFRLKIKPAKYLEEGNRIIQIIKRYSDTVPGWKINLSNIDGIRISADKYFGDGWFLLRMSLHEPYLVLNIESTSKKGIKMTLNRLMKIFLKINTLDTNIIEDYLKSN